MTHHVASLRSYYTVFALLLGLTLLTMISSFMPLGVWHTPMALGIAAVKAGLVFLYFMHLLQSPKLIWLIAGGTFLWLAIMIGLTLADYWTRPMMNY